MKNLDKTRERLAQLAFDLRKEYLAGIGYEVNDIYQQLPKSHREPYYAIADRMIAAFVGEPPPRVYEVSIADGMGMSDR